MNPWQYKRVLQGFPANISTGIFIGNEDGKQERQVQYRGINSRTFNEMMVGEVTDAPPFL